MYIVQYGLRGHWMNQDNFCYRESGSSTFSEMDLETIFFHLKKEMEKFRNTQHRIIEKESKKVVWTQNCPGCLDCIEIFK